MVAATDITQFKEMTNTQMYAWVNLCWRHTNVHQPEVEIGTFAKPMLDQLDHTIAAIHFLSKGM
jgi:hypothetical protein